VRHLGVSRHHTLPITHAMVEVDVPMEAATLRELLRKLNVKI
jgi:hypothetical protein